MFMKNYQTLFYFFIVAGSLISISASSWITTWVGLEINLMSLIPLILSELNFKSTESAIKYFLAQAMASVFLVATASIMASQETNFLFSNFNPIIFSSLAIKAGLAPFHFWFPQVMKSISWVKNILILVWQKIAPFTLMSCFQMKNILFLLIVSCAITGALGGLNTTDNKLILTYSSISHSAWMVILSSNSPTHWLVYFLIYSSLVIPIVMNFKMMNINKITELSNMKLSVGEKNYVSFMVMSLGGLPPFAGFSAKVYAIILLTKFSSLTVILILISSSLMSLFYYTKLFYNLLTKSSIENKTPLKYEETPSKNFYLTSIFFNLSISILVLLT